MHKAFASMNIAVIGEGKTSEYLAQNLALAGHDVYVGLKDDDADTSGYFLEEYDNMYICEVEEAAHVADLIIIASAQADVRQLAYMLEDVRRKVILDYTNNPNDTEAEKMHTVNAIKSITGSQHVVKCYDCSNYGPVLRSFFGGETVDLLVAGSSKKAKEAARILANDMGFENCHDFGGHNTIMLLDEMTKSWAKYSSGQGNKSSVKSDK